MQPVYAAPDKTLDKTEYCAPASSRNAQNLYNVAVREATAEGADPCGSSEYAHLSRRPGSDVGSSQSGDGPDCSNCTMRLSCSPTDLKGGSQNAYAVPETDEGAPGCRAYNSPYVNLPMPPAVQGALQKKLESCAYNSPGLHRPMPISADMDHCDSIITFIDLPSQAQAPFEI